MVRSQSCRSAMTIKSQTTAETSSSASRARSLPDMSWGSRASRAAARPLFSVTEAEMVASRGLTRSSVDAWAALSKFGKLK